MKTVFIVNPKAGKRKNTVSLTNNIKKVADNIGSEVQIYITKSVGDAEDFVRSYCQSEGDARFIACGGDGTVSEVLNGAIDFENAEIGVIPIGTGNDFCRNFENCSYNNIEKQITGNCVKCDAIKYITTIENRTKRGYCANMFNIGFDCNVVDITEYIKNKTFASGSFAYYISILLTLIKKKSTNLRIELDGKLEHEGNLLLTSIANGCYCGGGVKSNPLASVNDGLININIIKDISRLKFISLLPRYMKGNYLSIPKIEKIILSKKCKKVTVTPLDDMVRLCIDGEISDAGKIEFEIVHDAFNFVLPN